MTQPRYTFQFWLLCLGALLFFASFNMLIPELPAFLTAMGGGEHKGLIISLFTLTALLSRPFSGKLADSIGRKPVIIFGGTVCMLCSLMYPILTTVFGFLMLRLIHGFSTGFTPTGQSAYVSDVVPAERRGEAMGLIGTFGTLGMVMGPAIGGIVARAFGLNAMFYLSSAFGFIAAAIVMSMKETLTTKRSFHVSMLKVSTNDLFEPRVILPAIIMGLIMFAYGTVLTLIADMGEHVGIHKKEFLFICFTITSLAVRIVGGRASDKYGRIPVMVFSCLVIAISMMMIAVAQTQTLLIAAVLIYGFGSSASPTLLAWATDLSEEKHKGRALASLYIFMELGIGVGAVVAGWLFNRASDFFLPFMACGVLAGIAFVILLMKPLLQRG